MMNGYNHKILKKTSKGNVKFALEVFVFGQQRSFYIDLAGLF